jgi:hypothetical protein
MISSRFAITCALAISATTACTDTESATNLNPDGPPMIEQVLLTESVFDASGNASFPRVFAFGTLPGVDPSKEHEVTSAAVFGQNGQKIRIVFDEVLQGNRLEEIECRANVGDDGQFARIPDGTTPDDIAKCAVAKDVLPSSCKGDHAVCLCEKPTGCIVGADMVAMGAPVGVQDVNADGAADHHRFIPTSVQLVCGSMTINADPTLSYWYPSGDQQPPATGGVEAIGPAVVFEPQPQAMTGATMPTNVTCGVKFADDIVDKSNIKVCAPAGGRTPECSGNLDLCTQSCTPGDVSAISFKTEPLTLAVTFDTSGVGRADSLLFGANTIVDSASLAAAVTMTQAGANFTAYTITATNPPSMPKSQITVLPTAATGWAADTDYTITFSTGLKDAFGQPLPAPVTVNFHTGA